MDMNEIQKNLIADKKVPPIKTGDIVRVVQEFEEGDSVKQQIFEGVVISVSGSGISKTFMVRKVTAGIGVEKVYPIYSPTIKKIEIKKSSKIKRAKLYWLRDRVGRAARLQEKDLDPEVIKLMAAEDDEAKRKIEVAKKIDRDQQTKPEEKTTNAKMEEKAGKKDENKEKSEDKKDNQKAADTKG